MMADLFIAIGWTAVIVSSGMLLAMAVWCAGRVIGTSAARGWKREMKKEDGHVK